MYAILDVETTGLDREKDRILQIGVVKVENNVITPWMTYCNPGPCERIEEQTGAYQVHKISSEFLRGKPTFPDVAPKLCKFLENVEIVVCYNCIFDWDLLMAEFNRLEGNEHNKALMKKIKWIDLYRFAIKSFPDLQNYDLATLLDKFSIRIKKDQSVLYLYKTFSMTEDRDEFEVHSLFEQGEKTNWNEGHHDAVCDSLAAHTLLNKLLEKNCYSHIAELVDNFPQCVLDTELFLALDLKLKTRRTTSKDLMPFGARAEKFYCTMPQLRGKTLEELSVDKIEKAKLWVKEDRREHMIYRTAILNKVHNSQKRKVDSRDSSVSHKELKTK